MSKDQLLSVDAVAELLDVSSSTLAKWRQTGEPDLPFLRINGRVRYRASDIEEFLANAESEDDDEASEDDCEVDGAEEDEDEDDDGGESDCD